MQACKQHMNALNVFRPSEFDWYRYTYKIKEAEPMPCALACTYMVHTDHGGESQLQGKQQQQLKYEGSPACPDGGNGITIQMPEPFKTPMEAAAAASAHHVRDKVSVWDMQHHLLARTHGAKVPC